MASPRTSFSVSLLRSNVNFSILMFDTAVLPFLADAGASAPSESTAGIIIGSGAVGSLCTLAATWIKAKFARKVEGEVRADVPQPLSVELKERFVTKETFRDHCNRIENALKDHVEDNERNFEALYNLVRANDKLTATIAGTLEAIKGDLSLIKDKLFKRTR